jgi:hypothetical protein
MYYPRYFSSFFLYSLDEFDREPVEGSEDGRIYYVALDWCGCSII